MIGPIYIFTRRRALEIGDRILAGKLEYNGRGPSGRLSERGRQRHYRQLREICDGLARDAASGLLSDVKIGWPGIFPPADANEAALAQWRSRAVVFFMRATIDGDVTYTHELAAAGIAEGRRKRYVGARKD